MTYHFLNLDLQPIGDEGTWDGSLDSEYNNMSPTAPSNGGSGGSSGTGSGYLYLGLNGQWGTYGSGSSGGSGWSPVPMNGSDPATGYSLPPNLPETLPYLQALEVILKVATALISPQPETVAKKAMLHQVRDLLVHEVGLYARDYGVYSGDNYTRVGLTQAMDGVFNNIFVTAYGSNGSISKIEAVNQGIALAKALLADTRSVRLQTFQAQVLATTLGTVDPAQHTPELRQTALALADSYSRFRPGTDSYQGMATNLNSSYLDALWQLQQPFVLGQRPAYWNSNQTWGATTAATTAWNLHSELNWKQTANHAGLTEINALKALRTVNTLLGALSQISPLWQGPGSGVQDGIFLRQALGLAMALAKLPTSPSSTAGDSGNWVNAILQGDAQTAATGLAQLFAGMETADPLRLRQQLNFVETLLNVAAAVDDPTLDQVVLQSGFLSQYLNLGGAYAALNPNVDGTLGFFLDTAWQERSQDFNFGSGYVGTGSWSPISVKASNELEGFLQELPSSSRQIETLGFQRKLVRILGKEKVSTFEASLSNPTFLNSMLDWGVKYIRSQDDSDLFVNDIDNFFDAVANNSSTDQILIASSETQGLLIAKSPSSWLNSIINSKPFKYTKLSELANIVRTTPDTDQATIKAYIRLILSESRNQKVFDAAKIGFMLGIANHETQYFSTLEEIGDDDYWRGYDGLPELMNDVVGDGKKYRGRGFVQLTGKLSYLDYTNRNLTIGGVKLDLYNNPNLAAQPRIAAFILVDYLTKGRITAGSAAWEYTPSRDPLPYGQTFPATPQGYWYKITNPQQLSINMPSLNWSDANVFTQAGKLVNGYKTEALEEVVNYSEKFFSKLSKFQGQ